MQPDSQTQPRALVSAKAILRGMGMQEWWDNLRDAADLNAQMDMAYWAKWMFWATIGSLCLSGGALWGLYKSLGQTRTSILQAKQTGALERRAWVIISSVELIHCLPIENEKYLFRFAVKIENSGLLPAQPVNICARLKPSVPSDHRGVDAPGWFMVPPKHFHKHEIEFFEDIPNQSSAMNAELELLIQYVTSEVNHRCVTEAEIPIVDPTNKSRILSRSHIRKYFKSLTCGPVNHTRMT